MNMSEMDFRPHPLLLGLLSCPGVLSSIGKKMFPSKRYEAVAKVGGEFWLNVGVISLMWS